MSEPPKFAAVVRDGYDRIGERYLEWTLGDPIRRRFLDEAIARLSPDSRVIELGCGPGDPVTRTLSADHRVTAVDISREQLRLARRAAPRVHFVHADITQVEFPEGCADAVVSFYVLGHLPPGAHLPLLRNIAAWLRPGGFMLISTPLGASDVIESDWLGVPMYFGGLDESETLAAVATAGLRVEVAESVSQREHEQLVAFLWIIATKDPPRA
jgi:SAM-dependent methyltransferase